MFETPYEIAFLIIGIIGSLTTVAAFFPQCIKTIKTHDTSGLSLTFFIIAIVSSFFWLTTGTMSICSPYILGFDKSTVAASLASGLPSIITNVITLVLNVIIIFIKIKNVRNAKKNNVSEQVYCEKFIKKHKH